MQITCKFLLSTLCALAIPGCSHRAILDEWVNSKNIPIVPLLSTEIDAHDIKEISPELESELESVMIYRNEYYLNSAIMLKKDVFRRFGFPDGAPENGYFVRAVSDHGNGSFSAYTKNGELLVLFNKMGGCSDLRRRVIFIRLDSAPKNIYSGCSGAL